MSIFTYIVLSFVSILNTSCNQRNCNCREYTSGSPATFNCWLWSPNKRKSWRRFSSKTGIQSCLYTLTLSDYLYKTILVPHSVVAQIFSTSGKQLLMVLLTFMSRCSSCFSLLNESWRFWFIWFTSSKLSVGLTNCTDKRWSVCTSFRPYELHEKVM